MADDWMSDPTLSAEEKLARFESMGPQLTVGPHSAQQPEDETELVVTYTITSSGRFVVTTSNGPWPDSKGEPPQILVPVEPKVTVSGPGARLVSSSR